MIEAICDCAVALDALTAGERALDAMHRPAGWRVDVVESGGKYGWALAFAPASGAGDVRITLRRGMAHGYPVWCASILGMVVPGCDIGVQKIGAHPMMVLDQATVEWGNRLGTLVHPVAACAKSVAASPDLSAAHADAGRSAGRMHRRHDAAGARTHGEGGRCIDRFTEMM